MVAINSALEVDLTGQVCADSIGTKFYSGIGGQVDFIEAHQIEGGKPIIALPSTTKNDTISRIVPTLKPGQVLLLQEVMLIILLPNMEQYIFGEKLFRKERKH